MITTFCGHQVRFTDAIYERHLLFDGATLWLGRHELYRNVLSYIARGDHATVTNLIERMDLSLRLHKSLPWRDQ